MAKLERLKDYVGSPSMLKKDIEDVEAVLKRELKGEARLTSALVNGIKQNVMTTAREIFREALENKILEYKIFHGERAEGGSQLWDEGMDTAIEEITMPHIDVLSQNWLGTETIDTRVHEEGEVDRLCKSFGAEIYKQLTDKATPEETFEALGIRPSDFSYLLSEKSESKKDEDDITSVGDFVTRAARANKGAFDPILMIGNLDNATDSDDILADGGVRAVIKPDPKEDITPFIRGLQTFRRAHGANAIAKLSEMITNEIVSPSAPAATVAEQPPAKTEAPSKKKSRKSKKDEGVSCIVPPGVLKSIQDALGNDDTAMGALVGCSRQAWGNYTQGKREFKMNATQKTGVEKALSDRQTSLVYAMQQMETFDELPS